MEKSCSIPTPHPMPQHHHPTPKLVPTPHPMPTPHTSLSTTLATPVPPTPHPMPTPHTNSLSNFPDLKPWKNHGKNHAEKSWKHHGKIMEKSHDAKIMENHGINHGKIMDRIMETSWKNHAPCSHPHCHTSIKKIRIKDRTRNISSRKNSTSRVKLTCLTTGLNPSSRSLLAVVSLDSR